MDDSRICRFCGRKFYSSTNRHRHEVGFHNMKDDEEEVYPMSESAQSSPERRSESSVRSGDAAKKRLKRNKAWVKMLCKARTSSDRKFLLGDADRDHICCIIDCLHNVQNGNVKISPTARKKIMPFKATVKQLLKGKGGVHAKKKLLIQKGGFLPALLVPVLAAAASLISDIIL